MVSRNPARWLILAQPPRFRQGGPVTAISVPLGKLPFSPSGQRRWPEAVGTTAPWGRAAEGRHLDSRIASALWYATVKVRWPNSKAQSAGDPLRGAGAPSRHDTTIMAYLHWGASRGRLRRGGRLARLPGQPRWSGHHPPLDPLER
eukprot:4670715-Prymnesium_polylepis.1